MRRGLGRLAEPYYILGEGRFKRDRVQRCRGPALDEAMWILIRFSAKYLGQCSGFDSVRDLRMSGPVPAPRFSAAGCYGTAHCRSLHSIDRECPKHPRCRELIVVRGTLAGPWFWLTSPQVRSNRCVSLQLEIEAGTPPRESRKSGHPAAALRSATTHWKGRSHILCRY